MIGECRPMLLDSTMKEDDSLLVVQMTTPDLTLPQEAAVPSATLHAFRSLIVEESGFYEHLELTNYSTRPVELFIRYFFGADYRDVFEIRGARRDRRGQMLKSEITRGTVTLGYRGLDDQERRTRISFEGDIVDSTVSSCVMQLKLDLNASSTIQAAVTCSNGKGAPRPRSYGQAAERIA